METDSSDLTCEYMASLAREFNKDASTVIDVFDLYENKNSMQAQYRGVHKKGRVPQWQIFCNVAKNNPW